MLNVEKPKDRQIPHFWEVDNGSETQKGSERRDVSTLRTNEGRVAQRVRGVVLGGKLTMGDSPIDDGTGSTNEMVRRSRRHFVGSQASSEVRWIMKAVDTGTVVDRGRRPGKVAMGESSVKVRSII